MSRIVKESIHTYKKTMYKTIPYEKEINEVVTKVIGRKCDRCDHIFKETESYCFYSYSQEHEDYSVDRDICVKCSESEFKQYMLEDEYDNLVIGKRINYIK